MYYFYYRECCRVNKKTAIAFKTLREGTKECGLNRLQLIEDGDVEGYTTNKNRLPHYVQHICGEVLAHRVWDEKRKCDVWKISGRKEG